MRMADPTTQESWRIDSPFLGHAHISPDETALVQDAVCLSYRQAADQVDHCARGLIARGVTTGDRVAVFGYSSIETAVVFLATASIGAAYVGLSPKYRSPELRHILDDCEPALVFSLSSEDDHTRLQRSMTRTVPTVDFRSLLGSAGSVAPSTLARIRESVDPASPAVILYTSGSTGSPKGAMISHRSLLAGVAILEQLVPDRPRCLTDYPINHISWVLETCLLTLSNGGTLYLRERFNPYETLRMIEAEGLTVWQGAPTMYHLCLQDESFSKRDLTSVETLLFFGGPLPVSVLRTLGKKTGARLATGWGMTETAGGCTLTEPDADLGTLATTVGRPDPRVELKIADERGRQVAVGDAGEICVRGDVLFLGYMNRPEATTETFDADGFLCSGDIAVEQPDGNIRLVGRKKEMFKSGGYNVYPTEVEAVLGEHPGVALAGVLPIADALWGEVGVAFIAPRSSTAPTSDELESFCRERLANYKIPKRFLIRDDLPILPSGKVDKRSLKEWRLEDHD